eukprot:TRINITY_DN3027_c0_g1_i1.p1 TRINITY_DN3027_c0_g1~~TRINITY_DN3027_c0_g1_i1.p1  ORF type:complete len:395 (-),score=81.99 TRINITY_DN3027_c0_g1_i1:1176-2360(-)
MPWEEIIILYPEGCSQRAYEECSNQVELTTFPTSILTKYAFSKRGAVNLSYDEMIQSIFNIDCAYGVCQDFVISFLKTNELTSKLMKTKRAILTGIVTLGVGTVIRNGIRVSLKKHSKSKYFRTISVDDPLSKMNAEIRILLNSLEIKNQREDIDCRTMIIDTEELLDNGEGLTKWIENFRYIQESNQAEENKLAIFALALNMKLEVRNTCRLVNAKEVGTITDEDLIDWEEKINRLSQQMNEIYTSNIFSELEQLPFQELQLVSQFYNISDVEETSDYLTEKENLMNKINIEGGVDLQNRTEEHIKGNGLFYSWQNVLRTDHFILQEWGKLMNHPLRVALLHPDGGDIVIPLWCVMNRRAGLYSIELLELYVANQLGDNDLYEEFVVNGINPW